MVVAFLRLLFRQSLLLALTECVPRIVNYFVFKVRKSSSDIELGEARVGLDSGVKKLSRDGDGIILVEFWESNGDSIFSIELSAVFVSFSVSLPSPIGVENPVVNWF